MAGYLLYRCLENYSTQRNNLERILWRQSSAQDMPLDDDDHVTNLQYSCSFMMKDSGCSVPATSDTRNNYSYSGCEFCKCYDYKSFEVHQHIHDSKAPLEYLRGVHKTYSKKTLPPSLIIKKSEIPGAGLGVFAAVDIPSGTVFGPYKGTIHHGKIRGKSSNFSWQIIKNKRHSHIVDASDPADSNWMRYVNCSRTEDEQNVTAFQHQWEIYYTAHQFIPVGTEVLVYYGSQFGNHLGIKHQKVLSSGRIRTEMRRNVMKARRKSVGGRPSRRSSSG